MPDDYARAGRILDTGEAFLEGTDRAMGFLEENGRLWRAVVKATADGSEIYLVTLHKAQPHNLAAARARWAKIDQEGRMAPGGS